MEFDGSFYVLGTTLKVFFIDLLLSGDNAIVIALACRSLAPDLRRKAVLVGTGAAILLRVYLTTVVAFLLDVPGLKLVGAVALVIIAIKLMVEEDDRNDGAAGEGDAAAKRGLWSAIGVIVVTDLVMSLDNVVALAAVARGSIWLLVLGLLLSVPLLMYGSLFVTALLNRYPALIAAGGALLGWIAGDIGISDPIIADWVNTQAPALAVVTPLLGAVFVLLESRIVEQDLRAAPVTPSDNADSRQAKAPSGHEGGGEVVTAVARFAARYLIRKSVAPDSSPPPARVVSSHVPPSVEEAEAAGALVLVAEDNPMDQAELKHALEWLGYAVEVAHDGKQALDMQARRRYGLIITDLYMPGMDAFRLTAQIRMAERDTGRRIPIIAFVAHTTGSDRDQRYIDAGMDDCLTKPVAVNQLEAIVARWCPAAAPLRRQSAAVAAAASSPSPCN